LLSPPIAYLSGFRLFQNGEQFVVDLFERYVVKRDRLGFLEMHLAALRRALELAEVESSKFSGRVINLAQKLSPHHDIGPFSNIRVPTYVFPSSVFITR